MYALDSDALLKRFAPMVRRIASHIHRGLAANVDKSDLIQNGMIGLLDAISKFSGGNLEVFESYAFQRIRGAIMDGLRAEDWVLRSARTNAKKIEHKEVELQQALGRTPNASELAESMDMELGDVQKVRAAGASNQWLYLEDLKTEDEELIADKITSEEVESPLELYEKQEAFLILNNFLETLPDREKLIAKLHYEDGLTFREISKVLEITPARVGQIHTKIIEKIRKTFRNED